MYENRSGRIIARVLCVMLGCTGANCIAQEHNTVKYADTALNKLDEVVVSGSRMPEKYIESPASISLLRNSELRKFGGVSLYDAIGNMKGVLVTTPSLGFQVINTRGFSNTTNVRFVQMIDGIDNQAPHIGAPIANALGPEELDIESIELVQGTACAMYGMNAINGMVNIRTKDPFESTGCSFKQLIGVNHAGDNKGASLYTRYAVRLAKKLNKNVAFKINAAATNGTDWVADDRSDLASSLNKSLNLTGKDNPAYDEVNSYGNESPNRKTLPLAGKNYTIARTGYRESEIEDYIIKNYKADAGIYFRMNRGGSLSVTVKAACINTIYQRSNRFHLKNYWLSQYALNYQSGFLDVKSYITSENTGKSYNIRSLAENMDRSFKPDSVWFRDYANAFNKTMSEGGNIPDAHKYARQVSDNGRFMPGTESFNEKKETLTNINNWDLGAALRVKARMYHAEGIFKWNRILPKLNDIANIQLLSGFDYRNYHIIPDGNYFINPIDSGKNLNYAKYGGFIQVNKRFFNDKIHAGFTFRADKTDYFSWKYNPRLTVVYEPNTRICIRSTYQSGYRFPSIFEGFSNVNSGGVKRIGGLKIMSQGIFESSYTKASINDYQLKVNNDININGLTQQQAIANNSNILSRNTYTYLEPEHIRSIELGTRYFALQYKLYIDVDAYYNIYNNFIAQIEASVPKTNNTDSVPVCLYYSDKQNKYRLWTNSKSKMYSYGSAISIGYRFSGKAQFKASVNFNKLDKIENKDGLEDGYNTPQWAFHTSILSDKILGNMGGILTLHYQSRYDYVSFLVSGQVPQYWSVDAQVYYAIKSMCVIKLGGTNIFNKQYVTILGGPAIGGMYYCSAELHF